MEEKNSDSKTMIIVLSIVIIVLVAIVIKMSYNKYYVDNSKLNNDEGHGTNIINDNEISIEENAFLNNYGIYLDYMFAVDKYKVYKKKNGGNEKEDEKYIELTSTYYLFDENKMYETIDVSTSDKMSNNYFLICDSSYLMEEDSSEEILGMLDLKSKKIISGYEDYSCGFHSDVSASLCKGDKTTLVQDKDGKFGIYSFADSKIILPIEYDTIYNNKIGKYLIEKNGKYGLIDDKMNYLLKLEYDYIGYNDKIGYIIIKNTDIKLLNDNLEEISIDKLNGLYDSALIKDDEIKHNVVDIDNSNSYFWSSGSYLIKANISNAVHVNGDEESYFKYNGSTFSGDQLFIYDQYGACNDKSKIYVINNNKVSIINSEEITASTLCF